MGTPAEVARLEAWLSDRYGGSVALSEPSTSRGEGFDSAIHLVRFSGAGLPEPYRKPLVLRVKRDVDRLDEARREAVVQAWLADVGYPVPRVLAVLEPGEIGRGPAQVMERMPGALMFDDVRRAPWRARRRLRQLASLHVRLHRLPIDGFPVADDVLHRRLRLVRHVAAELDDASLRASLGAVEALSVRLRDAPAGVCHGDFHPLNVLVGSEGASVVDWTDAGIGDRHGDVARTRLLFDLAAIAATGVWERRVLRTVGPVVGRAYLRAYERELPVDRERLALWTPVHLLHGWSQALSLHAGRFDRGAGVDERTERVPLAMVGELRDRFRAALAQVT